MTEHPEDQPNGGAQQPSEVAGQPPPLSESAAEATEANEPMGVDAPSNDTPVATDASSSEETGAPNDTPQTEQAETTPGESSLREQSSALLDRLVETYPAAFFPFTTRQVKPLKIGIHKDLEANIREWGFSPAVLKIALSRYTRARRYQVAILKEPQRFDLQGQEAGEVSDENRQIAQTRIDELNEKRKQQQAAIKAAKSASTNPANSPGGRPRPRNEPRKPQRNRKARDPRAARPPADASTVGDQTTPANATDKPAAVTKPSRQRPPRQKKPSAPREPTSEKLAALAEKFNRRS